MRIRKISLAAAVLLSLGTAESRAQFTVQFYNFSEASAGTEDAVSRMTGNPSVVASAETVNYSNGGNAGTIGGDLAFPGGVNPNNFGFIATATVQALAAGDGSVFNLGVNSDDGFSLLLNGSQIAQFPNPRGPADSIAPGIALHVGDVLQLNYFQNADDAEVELFTTANADGSGARSLLGSAESGIAVPEPSTFALGLAGLGLIAGAAGRRRRR